MRVLLIILIVGLSLASCATSSERVSDGTRSIERQHLAIDQAWSFETDAAADATSLADILERHPNVYIGRQGTNARVLVRGCEPVFYVNNLGKRLSYLEANVLVEASTVSHVRIRPGRKNPVYNYGPTIHIYTKRRA